MRKQNFSTFKVESKKNSYRRKRFSKKIVREKYVRWWQFTKLSLTNIYKKLVYRLGMHFWIGNLGTLFDVKSFFRLPRLSPLCFLGVIKCVTSHAWWMNANERGVCNENGPELRILSFYSWITQRSQEGHVIHTRTHLAKLNITLIHRIGLSLFYIFLIFNFSLSFSKVYNLRHRKLSFYLEKKFQSISWSTLRLTASWT